MNENTAKLVKALRSGEYTQTRGRLRKEDSFCCLGVATDLHRQATGEGKWQNDPIHGSEYTFVMHTEDGQETWDRYALPDQVRQWLGWTDTNGDYIDPKTGDAICLVNINDNGGTFAEIADIIEGEPEGLLA